MAVHAQNNAKLVTLANLALYNHTLIENLGLKQDNGAYEYAESSLTEDAKATNVKGALDHLYDLIATARTSAFASTNVSCDDPKDAFIKFSDGKGIEIQNTQLEFVSLDDNFVFSEEGDQSKLNFDIKSIGYGVTGLTEDDKEAYGDTGDTTATDPLTQRSYVHNEITKAIQNGTVSVATGKAAGTTTGIAEFTQVKNGEGQATSNDYYVHLTAGDNVYDILLNADDFVKDAFLNQVKIEKGSKDEDGTFTPTEAGDVYFKFVWNVDNGSEGEEEATKTTYVKTSDILGDLAGDKAISVADGKVSLSIAEGSALSQEDNALALKIAENSPLSQTAAGLDITVNGTVTYTKGDGKTWTTGKTDGIVSASALVDTVEDVVEYVNEKTAASKTECKAQINGTESAENDAFTVSSETGEDGQTIYTYNIITATDKDITDLFDAVI